MTASPIAPAAVPSEEDVARVLFERGRGSHDARSWETAGDAMREWILGHARAILALFAPILAEKERLESLNLDLTLSLVGSHSAMECAWRAERERCAKIAEDHGALVSNEPIGKACSRNIAAVIRAEGGG